MQGRGNWPLKVGRCFLLPFGRKKKREEGLKEFSYKKVSTKVISEFVDVPKDKRGRKKNSSLSG